jgi:hypothetical protein
MLIPIIAIAIAIVAILSSYFLGTGWAIGIMAALGIITGTIAYGVSSDAFQMFLMIGSFGFPLIAGAVALGIASGQSLRNRKYFLAACLFAPFPYFLWHTSFTAAQKASEEELALSYTLNNAQLIALIGGPFEVYPASATTYQDASKGRHEYAIKGRDNLYVIVDVFRNSGTPQFAIACVTTLSMGKREAGKDDCAQSTVPLPKLSNAQPIVPQVPQ